MHRCVRLAQTLTIDGEEDTEKRNYLLMLGKLFVIGKGAESGSEVVKLDPNASRAASMQMGIEVKTARAACHTR